jgi:hypothetical protein
VRETRDRFLFRTDAHRPLDEFRKIAYGQRKWEEVHVESAVGANDPIPQLRQLHKVVDHHEIVGGHPEDAGRRLQDSHQLVNPMLDLRAKSPGDNAGARATDGVFAVDIPSRVERTLEEVAFVCREEDGERHHHVEEEGRGIWAGNVAEIGRGMVLAADVGRLRVIDGVEAIP